MAESDQSPIHFLGNKEEQDVQEESRKIEARIKKKIKKNAHIENILILTLQCVVASDMITFIVHISTR